MADDDSMHSMEISHGALGLASCTATAWILKELVDRSIITRDSAIALVERVAQQLDNSGEQINFEAGAVVRAIFLPVVSDSGSSSADH